MTREQPRNALVDQLHAENRKLLERAELLQVKLYLLACFFADKIMQGKASVSLVEIDSVLKATPTEAHYKAMRAERARQVKRTAPEAEQDPGQSSDQEPRQNDP